MTGLKKLTLSAMLTALSAAFLWLASILPTATLAFCALASLPLISAVIELGFTRSLAVYAAVCLISFFILPDKFILIIFAAGFGLYSPIKYLIEKIRRLPIEIAVKLLTFNAAVIAAYFMAVSLKLIVKPDIDVVFYALILAAANIVFLVYDFGLSQLIAFYMKRLHIHINKGGNL